MKAAVLGIIGGGSHYSPTCSFRRSCRPRSVRSLSPASSLKRNRRGKQTPATASHMFKYLSIATHFKSSRPGKSGRVWLFDDKFSLLAKGEQLQGFSWPQKLHQRFYMCKTGTLCKAFQTVAALPAIYFSPYDSMQLAE